MATVAAASILFDQPDWAGSLGDFIGTATPVRPFSFDTRMDGTLTWEAETDTRWRAVLVDKDGTPLAQFGRGDINLGPIVETLNQTGEASATITANSPAGLLIEAADVKPGLEVQIWRGARLWFFGPIIDPTPAPGCGRSSSATPPGS